MNGDQAQGSWEDLKGRAKRIWGELTDDDFIQAEGSVDKLYGAIQKKFGLTKEKAKEKIDSLHM